MQRMLAINGSCQLLVLAVNSHHLRLCARPFQFSFAARGAFNAPAHSRAHNSRTTRTTWLHSSSRIPGNSGRLMSLGHCADAAGQMLRPPGESLLVIGMQVQRPPMDRASHPCSRRCSMNRVAVDRQPVQTQADGKQVPGMDAVGRIGRQFDLRHVGQCSRKKRAIASRRAASPPRGRSCAMPMAAAMSVRLYL